MLRHRIEPRPDWQKTVESQGMLYHTADGVPYWDESAYYEFTAAEVDALEAATYELDKMCLAAVEHVIDRGDFQRFSIPERYWDFIRQSWEHDEHTIYGRFDLGLDGQSPPKLLEYNADTPTALLEAAVVQWFWLKDRFPDVTQFNSIHDRLLEIFRTLRKETSDRFYFSALADCVEDRMTVDYLRDLAIQAGFSTTYLDVEQVGWHQGRAAFTDLRESPIRLCFKLYPWEWMLKDEFGPHLLKAKCQWFEPPWKAMLSNKAILAVLWEMYPGSPYLLEASPDQPRGGDYVKKPILGREGANVQVYMQGELAWETPGEYDGPVIYQQLWPLQRFDDKYFAVIGSWIVNGWSCGVGIREDESLVTGNLSRFVPHLYRA